MSCREQNDSIFEMYVIETSQQIDRLEEIVLAYENASEFPIDFIDEIFRIMHTIKGSSSMMQYNNIAALAHGLEDLFSFIREDNKELSNWSMLSDFILECIDFIKVELQKMKNGDSVDGNVSSLLQIAATFLSELNSDTSISEVKNFENRKSSRDKPDNQAYRFKAVVFFEDGAEMENVRAYQIVQRLSEVACEIWHDPEDLEAHNISTEIIRMKGLELLINTEKTFDEVHELLSRTCYIKQLELTETHVNSSQMNQNVPKPNDLVKEEPAEGSIKARYISVNVTKLDELMDLVGELVIAETMVTQNPDLVGLQQLELFHKAARHLQKITQDIQDNVMSIRMVPLTNTFQKMHRIVRDMCKKLDKNVRLRLIGEETEVDKNIIEYLSDPIMHLVRNALDHGIESPQVRDEKGKPRTGTLTLEAKNIGGEVLVSVREDGQGLNKEKIIERAKKNQLLCKSEYEMTDQEIFNLIFLPGFSTKENVSEFSGRGVGMDVVVNNIMTVGGTVSVDSTPNEGTTINIKIPLTLAIIDGMNVKVGQARYTIPMMVIKESLRPDKHEVITDPDGNEMTMIRGQCYPIVRLHERYGVETDIVTLNEGVLIMVEQDEHSICLFVDELLGQQQVVVKSLPSYLKKIKNIEGVSGCTLLGDGSISLILDVSGLINI